MARSSMHFAEMHGPARAAGVRGPFVPAGNEPGAGVAPSGAEPKVLKVLEDSQGTSYKKFLEPPEATLGRPRAQHKATGICSKKQATAVCVDIGGSRTVLFVDLHGWLMR